MTGLGLPRFQYTMRDVRTGATFLAYGSEVSNLYAELTAKRLLKQLDQHGISPEDVTVQTDNGGEFDGNVIHEKDRGFKHSIEVDLKGRLRFIPPACPLHAPGGILPGL